MKKELTVYDIYKNLDEHDKDLLHELIGLLVSKYDVSTCYCMSVIFLEMACEMSEDPNKIYRAMMTNMMEFIKQSYEED